MIDATLANEAKAIVALAFRNGPLEQIHGGQSTCKQHGQPDVSHITDSEMRVLMKNAVDHVYELLLTRATYPTRFAREVAYGLELTRGWDDPEERAASPLALVDARTTVSVLGDQVPLESAPVLAPDQDVLLGSVSLSVDGIVLLPDPTPLEVDAFWVNLVDEVDRLFTDPTPLGERVDAGPHVLLFRMNRLRLVEVSVETLGHANAATRVLPESMAALFNAAGRTFDHLARIDIGNERSHRDYASRALCLETVFNFAGKAARDRTLGRRARATA